MTGILFIHIPLGQLLLIALPCIMLAWGLAGWLRRVAYRRGIPGEEPDWSVPPLTQTGGSSLLHHWDVRVKIITILTYSFMIAALQNPAPAALAIVLSFIILLIAKTALAKVMLRVLSICGFIVMFLVVMPLTIPERQGDTIIVINGWSFLGFNLRGLRLAVTIAAKTVAITLLMEPFIATSPLPVTLHGLSKLGAPSIISQMVLLSYRYLHVFRHEARRMSAGMQVRGFRKRSNLQTLRTVANFLGMLFVRSFERTERVFDAMQARGHQGHFPEPAPLRVHSSDLIIMVAWLAVGVILITYDRFAY